MSEDFGTINARRGAERAREIEVIRQQYRRHRKALEEMTADAPTENLASEYQRLMREIDVALRKLDELEGRAPVMTPTQGDPLRSRTEPGMRPLVSPDEPLMPSDDEPERGSRVAMMIGAAVAALLLIGWLIWRASSERDAGDEAVVTQTVAVDTAPATVAPVPVLTITPAVNDYGVIRKGTRATRQFEIANDTEEPISIAIARSECRCLYYEHSEVIPPKGNESITVTVDGARAAAGALRERIAVTSKSDPSVATALEVIAEIR